MEIAVVVTAIDASRLSLQPWLHGREALSRGGIEVRLFEGREIAEAWTRPFDAMLLHVWQDWRNRTRFDPFTIMPLLERYWAYRAAFPQTVQIVHNHADDIQPYSLAYWRVGDPVLYRTPPYDRTRLAPFPPASIWAYEQVWGGASLSTAKPPRWAAGFIGSPTGPPGYRARVARATRKVGIGLCIGGAWRSWNQPLPKRWYDWIMSRCRIVVCPRGWGPQSQRHWEAWRSGKPVLTDQDCHAVEMIPGVRLEAGKHYLVFNDPAEIPDIVSDWTRPGRLDDLAEIGSRGTEAALGYDAVGRMRDFFERVVRPGKR